MCSNNGSIRFNGVASIGVVRDKTISKSLCIIILDAN